MYTLQGGIELDNNVLQYFICVWFSIIGFRTTVYGENVVYSNLNSTHPPLHLYSTGRSSVDETASSVTGDPDGFTISHESRLVKMLLNRYALSGTLARPIRNTSQAIRIDFGISLMQILDFDETNQVLSTNIWKQFRWEDQLLNWNPVEYDNITQILLRANDIWIPDIVLYNNADNSEKDHQEKIAVNYTGWIRWIPPTIYKSSCLIDMRDFPFDTQTCNFKFGSWMYDGNKLELGFYDNIRDIDMRNYINNSEFEVINTSVKHNVVYYPCCGDEPFPDITYYITIRRKAAFHIYVLILPSILLSFLTLVLFWIPPQRPDRTSLGMSLFSSFFVLLLILVQSAPPTSASISLLGMYYCINMVLIALSTILSAVVINLTHYMQKRRLPKFVKLLFVDFLGKALYAQCVDQVFSRQEPTPCYDREAEPMSNSIRRDNNFSRNSSRKEPIKIDILQATSWEWKIFAVVIDRLFFLLYVTGMILSLIFVFPRGSS